MASLMGVLSETTLAGLFWGSISLGSLKKIKVDEFIDVEEISHQFDRWVDYSKLPNTLAIYDTEEIVQAEQIQESQEHEELNSLTTSEKPEEFLPAPIIPWDGNYAKIFQSRSDELLFDVKIYYFPNFLKLSESHETSHHKRSYFQLVQVSNEGIKLMALDLNDANTVIKSIKNEIAEEKQYYLLSGSRIVASSTQSSIPKYLEEYLIKISIISKILRGESKLSEDEILYVKKQKVGQIEGLLHFTKQWTCFWPNLNYFEFLFKENL